MDETQIKEAIEKARLEERTKIHDKLSQAEQEAARMKAAKEEMELAFKEAKDQELKALDLVKKANETNEALKASITADKTVDVDKLVTEVAKSTKAALEGEYTNQLSELSNTVKSLSAELSTSRLSSYRTEAIQKAGGENVLITELVHGNSPAEIDASIQTAIAAFQRVKATVQPSSTNTVIPNAPSVSVPPVPSTALSQPSNLQGGVKQMTNAEYAKERTRLLAESAAAVSA